MDKHNRKVDEFTRKFDEKDLQVFKDLESISLFKTLNGLPTNYQDTLLNASAGGKTIDVGKVQRNEFDEEEVELNLSKFSHQEIVQLQREYDVLQLKLN